MKTFIVSVSRMAKGKAGYERNKYDFGWSFHPEPHTIESLIKLAAVEGYSFLAGEFARKPPAYYGRSNVNTARITENFRQTYIIPLDDDGHGSNAQQFWDSDKLFQAFGGGYYHSSSSTPARPRIRPIFELDEPITEGRLYQETRRAFAWYYNRNERRIDTVPQIPQVWYGTPRPAQHKIIGNTLPLQAVYELLLWPYRAVQAAKEREAQARQFKAQSESEQVNRILTWLAQCREGDNRNLALLWAAGQLKALGEAWHSVGAAVIEATHKNGYYARYAQSDREIQRIFERGIAR